VRNSLLVLCLLLAAPYGARAQAEPDEHGVFQAVLARFVEAETSRIVVRDSTRTSQINFTRRWRATPYTAIGVLEQRTGPLPNALLENFNLQNTSKVALRDSLDLSVQVEMLSEAEERALQLDVNTDGWNWVLQALPGSPGIVSAVAA
jgi:hypothetical protein